MTALSCVSLKKTQEKTWVEKKLSNQIKEAQFELANVKKERTVVQLEAGQLKKEAEEILQVQS